MNAAMKKDLVKQTWAQIQKEVKKVLNDNRVKEVQGLVKKFLAKAQQDYLKLMKGDINVNIKAVKKELKAVEKIINHLIQTEIRKAESFLTAQKKELAKFQNKLETALRKRGVKSKSSSKRKTTVKKKATKRSTTKSDV